MKPADIDFRYKDLFLEVGEKIKDLRKTKDISYTEMAKEIGISRNGYNNLELGKSNFQFTTLLRILSYHNISIFDFFESLKR
jgi:transcriptional regulator with XRE-family HTH domain